MCIRDRFPLKFSSSACQLSSKEKKRTENTIIAKKLILHNEKESIKKEDDLTVYSRFLRARHRAFYTGMGGV